MPFKSEAQRRKLKSKVRDGTFDKKTFDMMESETKGKLPERLHPKRTRPARRQRGR